MNVVVDVLRRLFDAPRGILALFSCWDLNEKPLVYCVRKNLDSLIIYYLLERGKNPNEHDTWESAIEYAAGNGNAEVVSLLINYGARPTFRALEKAVTISRSHWPALGKRYCNEHGDCITVSYKADYKKCISLLCDADPKLVDQKNDRGNTALMLTAGATENVEMLLRYNPCLLSTNNEGFNAFDVALNKKYTKCAALIEAAMPLSSKIHII